MSLRSIVHLLLHFAVPLGIAFIFFRNRWRRAFVIMAATMLVDLDHLLADPIYDPNRCSIGFHPLHTWPAILVYVAFALFKRTQLIGIGLLLHMALDASDCWAQHRLSENLEATPSFSGPSFYCAPASILDTSSA